jgi:tetratricopeptide (TPR) repeat protein
MKRTFALIAVVISTTLTVLGALSPEKVDNLRLDFGLFLARELRYELMAVLGLGMLIYFAKPVRNRIFPKLWSRRPEFAKFSDNQKIAAVLLSVLTLGFCLLMLLGIVINLIGATVARVRFYDTLYSSYRVELMRKGLARETTNEPDKAIQYYKRILQLFPNDPRHNYLVQQRIDRIEGRLGYARHYLRLSQELEKQTGLSRQSFLLLLEALRLDPTDDFIRSQVQERIQKLKEAEPRTAEFYKACEQRNETAAAKLFSDWSWFLFEEYFRQDIKSSANTGRLDIDKDLPFLRTISAATFREAVLRSWELDNARKILEQSVPRE